MQSIDTTRLTALHSDLAAEIARVAAIPNRQPFEGIGELMTARERFNKAMFDTLPAIIDALTRPRAPYAIERIWAERRRQYAPDSEGGEGWSAAHDDAHAPGVLAAAGACYIDAAHKQLAGASEPVWREQPAAWPWQAHWWKPSPDPARNLEKGAALAAAELERTMRASQQGEARP